MLSSPLPIGLPPTPVVNLPKTVPPMAPPLSTRNRSLLGSPTTPPLASPTLPCATATSSSFPLARKPGRAVLRSTLGRSNPAVPLPTPGRTNPAVLPPRQPRRAAAGDGPPSDVRWMDHHLSTERATSPCRFCQPRRTAVGRCCHQRRTPNKCKLRPLSKIIGSTCAHQMSFVASVPAVLCAFIGSNFKCIVPTNFVPFNDCGSVCLNL
jgi:hypothetical protein